MWEGGQNICMDAVQNAREKKTVIILINSITFCPDLLQIAALPCSVLARRLKGCCCFLLINNLKKVSDVTFGLTIKHKHLMENVSNSDDCFRYIVTNDGRSSDLQVWKLGEDSGELNPTLITINQENKANYTYQVK